MTVAQIEALAKYEPLSYASVREMAIDIRGQKLKLSYHGEIKEIKTFSMKDNCVYVGDGKMMEVHIDLTGKSKDGNTDFSDGHPHNGNRIFLFKASPEPASAAPAEDEVLLNKFREIIQREAQYQNRAMTDMLVDAALKRFKEMGPLHHQSAQDDKVSNLVKLIAEADDSVLMALGLLSMCVEEGKPIHPDNPVAEHALKNLRKMRLSLAPVLGD